MRFKVSATNLILLNIWRKAFVTCLRRHGLFQACSDVVKESWVFPDYSWEQCDWSAYASKWSFFCSVKKLISGGWLPALCNDAGLFNTPRSYFAQHVPQKCVFFVCFLLIVAVIKVLAVSKTYFTALFGELAAVNITHKAFCHACVQQSFKLNLTTFSVNWSMYQSFIAKP